MNLFVLDTDTLSLLERGNESVYKQILTRGSDQVAVSVVTVEEQMQGRINSIRAAKTRDALLIAYGQLAATTDALRLFVVLNFTEASVDIYENLWSLKLNVGKNDLRIAAIALESGATVVTRNRRDFERAPGLAIEDWSLATP